MRRNLLNSKSFKPQRCSLVPFQHKFVPQIAPKKPYEHAPKSVCTKETPPWKFNELGEFALLGAEGMSASPFFWVFVWLTAIIQPFNETDHTYKLNKEKDPANDLKQVKSRKPIKTTTAKAH